MAGAGDVMNADDGGAATGRLDGQPHRGRIAPARLGDPGQPADEALARRADQHRIAGIAPGGRRRRSGPGSPRRSCRSRCPDRARYGRGRSPAAWQPAARSSRKSANLLDDVAIGRTRRTCPPAGRGGASARPAPPALHDQRHQRRIVAQRRHVVDDARAGIEAARATTGSARVDRDRDVCAGQALDDRQDAAQLLVRPRSAASPAASTRRRHRRCRRPPKRNAGHRRWPAPGRGVHRRRKRNPA